MQMDFTVPIIDNFGDMGFALSLAVSMMEKHPDLTIRFWSEDAALFERMLAGKIFPRLGYHALADWSMSDHSEIRCNFFGLKLVESELQWIHPHTILNFDYLQFHKNRWLSDPGAWSIHGTTYTIGKSKVIHLVPTILEEGAGIVLPEAHVALTRESFIQKYTLDTLDQTAQWCSIFVYPATLEAIRKLAEKHSDIQFLICGGQNIDLANCISLPFLALTDYQDLLAISDTNIVRWENSLIAASLAGKPFLWDIYRENNDVHFEKIQDFKEIFDEHGKYGKMLVEFISVATQHASLEELLVTSSEPFLSLAKHTKSRDIRTTIDQFLI